ncbi:MAG: MobC family plasmid mobilization relaxosome protein [Firmicutes bacterium]|nr:MobC family plasmid mobilization relaxosome protein [Bacillota bacterium]
MSKVRCERFTVRLSPYEKAFIVRKMRESGYNNLGDYFMHCVSSNRTTVVDTMPIWEIKTELNKIGTNINQIAKKANTNGFLSDTDIRELKEDMREVKDTVNMGLNPYLKGGDVGGLCEDSTHQAEHTP